MIRDDPFPFFDQLKPGLKFELVEELFGDFAQKFDILFLNPGEGYRAD